MDNTRNNFEVGGETAFLVHVSLPGSNLSVSDSLAELGSLAAAAGADVVGHTHQRRSRINSAYCVGKGKAEQIAEQARQHDANVVIFDNDLSPAQIRELEKIIELKVLDRSELILDIFASRAETHEARLQVDLAQLEYTYPRLTGMWTHLDKVVGGSAGGSVAAVGGIGTRGTGEKQLEIDRRIVQRRIGQLRRQIKEIDQRKKRQILSRGDQFQVSLVGYTNAGKSSLLNTLTDSDEYVEDKLFATLDTKTCKWRLKRDQQVLLSDTVGFVRNLPHHLVASFRATLEEALNADLLLHVVDVSSEKAELEFKAARAVLNKIGCSATDTLIVFNKVDRPSAGRQLDIMAALYPDAICLSARTGRGIDRLVDVVCDRLVGRKLHLSVCCRQSDGRIPGFLRACGTILSETYQDSTVTLEAYLGAKQLAHLEHLRPESYRILES